MKFPFTKIQRWPILFAVFFFCIACGRKRNVHLPDRLVDTIPIVIKPSVFNLSLSYSVEGLQEFLNEKFHGEFLRTAIHPMKDENNGILVVLSKKGNIKLSTKGQQMICTFPLHVHAEFMHTKLNVVTKGIKPVEAELVVTMQTPIGVQSDWHLKTRFKLTGLRWVKNPKLVIAKQNINLSKKINNYLEKNKEEVTTLLDKEVNKAVSLEKPIGKVWTDLQKPIVISRKAPKTYVRFILEDLRGLFSLDSANIRCAASIDTRIAILTDTTEHQLKSTLPSFKPNNQVAEYSTVNVYAFSDFGELSENLSSILSQKPISVAGQTVTIKRVEVYGSKLGLTVVLETKGDLGGTLVATGQPVYDSLKQTVALENFEFQLSSDNTILNAGETLLHNVVRDTVKALLNVGMGEMIGKVPGIIEHAIAKGKPGKSIDAHIEEFDVHSCEIALGARRIHVQALVTFKGAIIVKHLNPGKEIEIRPKKKKLPV